MNPFIESVRSTEALPGTAVLWWLGQMGLLIKMNQTVICVDYYASVDPGRLMPVPVPPEEMAGIDAFLGTHDHIDHIDHKSWKIWARSFPDSRFVCPAYCMESVLADGVRPENCSGIDEGMKIRIGDVTVSCIAAAHEFRDRDPVTGHYPYLQYIIEGNGVRIYHAGDTLRYEGMLPKLQAFGAIDAALLPINGRDGARYRSELIGNMTFQEAVDLAGELNAGLAIPGHFDMFEGNTADPAAFADYLNAKYPGRTSAVIPKYLEPIRISGTRPMGQL